MAYRTIIFDFDGTLADTLEETRRIYNQLAVEYSLREVQAEELPELRKFSLLELLDHLDIPKRRVPTLLSRGTSMMRSDITRLALIPGIGEVIPAMRARAKSFGVLTSNAEENVDLFLKAHGLRDHFDFISSTSRLTGKSGHLRAIRKTFSLHAEEMLYVGDEIRDIKASKKAGIAVAAVTWGFNSADSLAAESPEHLLHHPDELLSLVPEEA
ncbi:HAD hydrolase-like protein [Luteolibacter flavescens]|uniref:HAD hydrolase-like protein n=1 Tax=Luteolibacter flavescens TaxID=1859460 RepID=A0ABT3FVI4_9BACT|nr:HAD hydrolase-like protein [Luteolibacter flavescens]MCW1887608.1 HAD hydrolase-like protein [Luteolibacter flavescens]